MNSPVKTFSIVALFFLFTLFGFSQTTITITLIVDTKNFDPDDWQNSCSFKAQWADTGAVEYSNGNLEDFLVEGEVGDTIIWQGESSSSNTATIDIKKIKYFKGTNIFKEKLYKGKGAKEKVKTKALYSTVNQSDYKYDLDFKIRNAGNAHGNYTIDPKMSIRPRVPIQPIDHK